MKVVTPLGAQSTAECEIQHFGYSLSLHILRMRRTQNKHFSESRLSSLAQAFVGLKALIFAQQNRIYCSFCNIGFDSILTDVILGHSSCTNTSVFQCLFGAETFSPFPRPASASSVPVPVFDARPLTRLEVASQSLHPISNQYKKSILKVTI